MAEDLTFPTSEALHLEPFLPSSAADLPTARSSPFLTLTFATSLDSALSLAPGVRTTLSGPESKAMTHHLRSRHSAILVGADTAIADDPGLCCRLAGCGLDVQPRPLVLDPNARWRVGRGSRVVRLAREGKGRGPFVITAAEEDEVPREQKEALEEVGGRYILLRLPAGKGERGRWAWSDIMTVLKREGLDSVMVEGGAGVINELLHVSNIEMVDSLIVTLAPTWLGKGGVVVSPQREQTTKAALRLKDVVWRPLGEDVVMCGRPRS